MLLETESCISAIFNFLLTLPPIPAFIVIYFHFLLPNPHHFITLSPYLETFFISSFFIFPHLLFLSFILCLKYISSSLCIIILKSE